MLFYLCTCQSQLMIFFLVQQCKDFEKVGATIAVTPCDVVEEADITFSCVADPQAAKEVNIHP